ncbi:hypothetical protein P5673_027102 [Acropora cervicornis]|uniref:Uncharacterized protein n=1 Tax=Acropora cervicornis TaxID=6130 RepID=A0AAD9PZJ1_ACRCE|nr:hypothetical protein P5673_027102 [Acropora cervicornis]
MDMCECPELTTATEKDSKLLGLLNSPLILKEILVSQSLPWRQNDEPTTPNGYCQPSFADLVEAPWENNIKVNFPDLKHVYLKIQSRANRLSRQRVENGKVKIRVISLGPQILSIEVYVERTPDAAVLFGDKCGRVRLKSQPGKYYPNQHYFTVDLDSVYDSPTNQGVPVYKLSTVDSERRNKFRLIVVVVLIGDIRSKEYISRSFRLRSRAGRFRSESL